MIIQDIYKPTYHIVRDLTMAEALEVKDDGSLEMCTQLPVIDEPKESQVFFLEGNLWKIRFIYDDDDEYYDAFISTHNTQTKFKPFYLDFSILFKNEKYPRLGKGNMILINSNSYRFCEICERSLPSKKSPNYSLADNFIKFVFRFHSSFPSTKKLSVTLRLEDKCGQTTAQPDATSTSSLCKRQIFKNKCGQTTSQPDATSTSSLCKDLSMMLESALYHDAEIKCGKETIKAHRCILSARSEVFKAMLQSNMVEGRTGIVEIKDIDVDCIQDFAKYLYTDTLPELTFDKAKRLYEVGDKYAVRSLMVRCKEYLQDNLSRENAWECLALADTHQDEKLKDKVIAYVLKTKLFFQDELWSPFCEQYPKIALHVYKLSYKNAS